VENGPSDISDIGALSLGELYGVKSLLKEHYFSLCFVFTPET
jgi:hypothetical protein